MAFSSDTVLDRRTLTGLTGGNIIVAQSFPYDSETKSYLFDTKNIKNCGFIEGTEIKDEKSATVIDLENDDSKMEVKKSTVFDSNIEVKGTAVFSSATFETTDSSIEVGSEQLSENKLDMCIYMPYSSSGLKYAAMCTDHTTMADDCPLFKFGYASTKPDQTTAISHLGKLAFDEADINTLKIHDTGSAFYSIIQNPTLTANKTITLPAGFQDYSLISANSSGVLTSTTAPNIYSLFLRSGVFTTELKCPATLTSSKSVIFPPTYPVHSVLSPSDTIGTLVCTTSPTISGLTVDTFTTNGAILVSNTSGQISTTKSPTISSLTIDTFSINNSFLYANSLGQINATRTPNITGLYIDQFTTPGDLVSVFNTEGLLSTTTSPSLLSVSLKSGSYTTELKSGSLSANKTITFPAEFKTNSVIAPSNTSGSLTCTTSPTISGLTIDTFSINNSFLYANSLGQINATRTPNITGLYIDQFTTPGDLVSVSNTEGLLTTTIAPSLSSVYLKTGSYTHEIKASTSQASSLSLTLPSSYSTQEAELRCSSSGVMEHFYRGDYSAKIYNAGPYSVIDDDPDWGSTKITLGSVEYGPTSMTSSTANSITIIKSGVYQVSAHGKFQYTAGGGQRLLQVVNSYADGNISHSTPATGGGFTDDCCIEGTIYLPATHTVWLICKQISGGAINLNSIALSVTFLF